MTVTEPKTAKLVIEGLCKRYGATTALEPSSLSVAEGEFLTLLGPSGSGKTTLLQLICGLVEASEGRVVIDGRDQSNTPVHQRDIGLVFQHYALFPHLTVAENIAFPLKMRGRPGAEIAGRVKAALDMVHLGHLAARFPRESPRYPSASKWRIMTEFLVGSVGLLRSRGDRARFALVTYTSERFTCPMLRVVPDKLLGVIVMGGAVLILFLLPWLDRSPVKSIRFRGWLSKLLLSIFVIAFVSLGWLGLQAGSETQTLMARIFTFYYFAFFIFMPIWTRMDAVKAVPERVTMHD